MITPTPLWRSNKAPKYTYEPWWGEDGAPPKTELPTPECPAEEIDSEPDMAKLKAWKIMKEEKKRDEMIAKKEDEKSEKAIKAAEEEQKKEDDEAAAKKDAADEKKDDAKKRERRCRR